MASKKLTAAEARALLVTYEPVEVAWTSKDGTRRDDDGESIDERCLVPWVMALGPYGSWPATLEAAEASFAEHTEWLHGTSMRLGSVVVWKRGWGYQAETKEEG